MIRIAQPIIEDDEKRAVIEALESGQLAQGPRVAAFEAAFAKYIGVEHAIAVNSGTAALHVALLHHTSNVFGRPNWNSVPEIIVPAFSFAATANSVLLAGARPVFVDVLDDDFGIDPAEVEAAITDETWGVIAVHLYGQPCAVDRLPDLLGGRTLIEDVAQAIGAIVGGRKVGSFGTGCYSFYATKNLQTGEGGMLTTNKLSAEEICRTLRAQGEFERYSADLLGLNYRMTEVAAALGLAQVPKIDARNEQRRKNAAGLTELLAPLDDQGRLVLPRTMPGRTHVWHQYTVRVTAGREGRDALQASMRERGIETAVFYPTPIHKQPLYQRLGYGDLHLPVAERLADEVLSLPVHPALSDGDLDQIARAVIESMA